MFFSNKFKQNFAKTISKFSTNRKYKILATASLGLATLGFYSYIVRNPELKFYNSKLSESRFLQCENLIKVPYVVIGGGTAAQYASYVIQKNDPNSKILIISDSPYQPYSFDTYNKNIFFADEIKGLLESPDEEIILSAAFPILDNCVPFEDLLNAEQAAVSYFVNSKVISIDSDAKQLTLNGGDRIEYNKLIIATEMKQNFLKIKNNNLINMDGIDSYKRLIHRLRENPSNITIIGNSVHAFSLSLALSRLYKNAKIKQITYDHPGFIKILPQKLQSQLLEEFSKNYEFIDNIPVQEIESSINQSTGNQDGDNDHLIVNFSEDSFDNEFVLNSKCSGSFCPEPHPLFSFGYYVGPNLQVKNGDIYVTGNNITYDYSTFQEPVQFSSFPHSLLSSKIGGRNAVGILDNYDYLPYSTYNIARNISIQMVGKFDDADGTTSVWKQDNRNKNIVYNKGVVFYHNGGIIHGILTWNIPGKLELCEEIIEAKSSINDSVELSKWLLPRTDNVKVESDPPIDPTPSAA